MPLTPTWRHGWDACSTAPPVVGGRSVTTWNRAGGRPWPPRTRGPTWSSGSSRAAPSWPPVAAEAVARFDRAAAAALSLGAPVVSAWASAAASLGTLPTDPAGAVRRAVSADQLARSLACPGAAALAMLVEAAGAGALDWRQAAAALEREGVVPMVYVVAHVLAAGPLATPEPVAATPEPVAATPEPVAPLGGRGRDAAEAEVRCLGPFALTVRGQLVDAGLARPRVRSLLHYLAMQVGAYVHRGSPLCCAVAI